jgi:Fe2+ transport system protein FeoA
MTLCDMKINQSATILEITNKSSIARRLFDMGFIAGQKVKCTNIGAFGSPIACKIHGCTVALRKSDAKELLIKDVC